MIPIKRNHTVILILAAAVCIGCAGCGKKEQPAQKAVVQPVKTMVVGGSVSGTQTYPAKVSAANKVNLSFRVSGPLIELPVKEGDKVQKGELLARIDPRDFNTALEKEKAIYDNAKANFERYKELFDDGVIAAIEYDQRKTEFEVAQRKFEDAKSNLEDTNLRAPFEGQIGEKFVENYQDVQAKEPILSIHDISRVELMVDIPESEIARANKDNPGRFIAIFNAAPDKEYDLEIKEFNISADSLTQTYRATFIMDQPDGINVLPGMSATVKRYLPETEKKSAASCTVPFHAIVSDESGGSFVWLVDPETMTVHKQNVKLGTLAQTGDIIVTEGLSEGDRVVVAGVSQLHEGQKIQLLNK